MNNANYPTVASEFVALRSYCRWLPEEERRETWEEVTDRVVSFLRTETSNSDRIPQKVWTSIKSSMLNFQVMPSMRLAATAGDAAKRNNICMYNCAYAPLNSLKAYSELMLILMSGTGFGFSVEKEYIRRLPIIKQPIGIRRDDYTVDDSREGWAKAFLFGLETWFSGEEVMFMYDNIRPYGSPLIVMGGRASGPEPLIELMDFTRSIIQEAAGRKLKTIECHDLACKVAEVVVAGGTRRSSCISFSDIDDVDLMKAKDGNYPLYRRMANNSAVYKEKPDTITFLKEWSNLAESGSGERGIVNVSNLDRITDTRKFSKDMRLNPCFTKDTLIATADGRGAVPIIDLVKSGKDVPVYSVNPRTHKVEIKMGRNPRITGINRKIMRITLDDDTSIKVTPDHNMILRDGLAVKAEDLVVGDSLCRLTKRLERISTENYLRVNCDTLDSTKDKIFEHRLIAEYNYPVEWKKLYNKNKKSGWIRGGLVVHHKDYDKTNNSPDNLIIMAFKDHCKLHSSTDTIGEKNGRYSGYSNDIIKEHAISLTKSFRRRFSTDEWSTYAKELGIPITFSQWRKSGFFYSVYELSVWAANQCNFISDLDPRTLKVHNSALQSGYECNIVSNNVMVYKVCEQCNSKFLILYNKREQSFCSRKCSSKHNYNFTVLGCGQDSKQLLTKNNQINIFNNLKLKLGRDPYKREWEEECSVNSISHRIQAVSQRHALASEHVFFSYKELKESAIEYNHKVKKIEYLNDTESVYNITVDDNHTVGIVTSFNEVTKECSGIFTFQCGEVILRPQQFCNLSEAVVRTDDDIGDLVEKVKTATWLGIIQSTFTHFPGLRDKWRKNAEEERLIGVSLTGQLDNPDILTDQVLKQLKKVTIKTAKHAAKLLGINEPAAFTVTKPSGTVSQVVNSSSGCHPRYSKYYIRRYRISKADPLFRLLKDQGITYHPEVGQTKDNATTFVVEFPTRSPDTCVTTGEWDCMKQLEWYLRVQKNWSTHNVSNTVYVKKNEWLKVGNWVYEHFDDIVGISFLPLDDTIYDLAPNEKIEESTYNELMSSFPNLDFSKLGEYEKVTGDTTEVAKTLACGGKDSCDLH